METPAKHAAEVAGSSLTFKSNAVLSRRVEVAAVPFPQWHAEGKAFQLRRTLPACMQWLYECAAAGEVVPLMPRHYISISAATLESLDDVSRFCDPCAPMFWPTLR